MTEYTISDNFRIDGLDRADATPNPGVDLGELNRRNLARNARTEHVPVEEDPAHGCREFPCFKCFPIDGCTG